MPHETLFQTIGLCSFISNDSKGLNYPSTIVIIYLMIVSVLNGHSDNIVIVQTLLGILLKTQIVQPNV